MSWHFPTLAQASACALFFSDWRLLVPGYIPKHLAVF